MLKGAGDVGVDWLTDLCNSVIRERKIPEDWRRSILVPVYKRKGEQLECGSCRAIKVLEHGMKMFERVLESKVREQVKCGLDSHMAKYNRCHFHSQTNS